MQRLRTVTSLDVSAVAGHHEMPAVLLFLKFVCFIEDINGLFYMQYLGVTRSVTHLIFKMNILLCPRYEMAEGYIEFTLSVCVCVCVFMNRVRAIT